MPLADASEVVKVENATDDTTSSASTDVASENVATEDSASPAAINGDATTHALKKVAMKRSGIHDEVSGGLTFRSEVSLH